MSVNTVFVAVRDADDQDPLVDAVLGVAVPTGASVVLARAYGKDAYDQQVDNLDFDSQPSPDDVARRSESVRTIARALDDAGVDYEIRGVTGESGDAYLDLAETVDPDLLYVQGKERSPTGKALFGSTAQQLLLNAPCPVTFVRS